jgi:hypothetical protein
MKTVRTIRNEMSTKRNYINVGLSLSLLFSVFTSIVPAMAEEGMSATAAGLGLDQDSLLPPEVVPLDPSVASRMSQSQAQSRAADMNASAPGLSNTPGLSNGSPGQAPAAPGMTAQEFRKAAFDSLYNQGTLPPSALNQNPSLQAMQGQMGQMPGQNPMNGQLHQSTWSGQGVPQQQTLTGSVSQPKQNNKLKKVSHVLNTATALGGGVLVGALMFRGASSPSAALGMGLLGAGVLNYGLRNAFRF